MNFAMCVDEEDVAWKSDANCLGVDPELFFPARGESNREAKAVCAGCTVRHECFDYAMRHHEDFGVWGGRSERERKRMRRERRMA